MNKGNIYIIVLNWQNAPETVNCLASLDKLDFNNYKIVVCDNNSQDSSVPEITKWCSGANKNTLVISETECDTLKNSEETEVFIIKNRGNYGYAGGNNVGIKLALQDENCEFIWILNNDTTVSPDSLSSMYQKMKGNSVLGICGSLLLHQNNKNIIQAAGGRFNNTFCTTTHLLEDRELNSVTTEEKNNLHPDYVVGASMLIKRDVFDSIGLLFEDYFLYYEEIDFCLRARKNYNVEIDFDSYVYHKLGDSIKKGKSELADYLSVRNRLIISRRFFPEKYGAVWLSLLGVLINRLKRRQFKRAIKILSIITIDACKIFKKYRPV